MALTTSTILSFDQVWAAAPRVRYPIAELIWPHDGWGLAPSVGASLSGGIQRGYSLLCCVFVIVRVNDLRPTPTQRKSHNE